MAAVPFFACPKIPPKLPGNCPIIALFIHCLRAYSALQFKRKGDKMFNFFNPNPEKRKVGDCSVRALAKALRISWEQAYILISAKGYEMGDMPSSNSVWGAVLRDNGFLMATIPNYCPDCYTIKDFCKDNPIGLYVLGTGTHVVAVEDGDYFDAWDSGNEIPVYMYYKR